MKTHEPSWASIRTASRNPTSGLFAMSDQTSSSQITTSRISHFTRSQSGIRFLVRMSSSLGRPPS